MVQSKTFERRSTAHTYGSNTKDLKQKRKKTGGWQRNVAAQHPTTTWMLTRPLQTVRWNLQRLRIRLEMVEAYFFRFLETGRGSKHSSPSQTICRQILIAWKSTKIIDVQPPVGPEQYYHHCPTSDVPNEASMPPADSLPTAKEAWPRPRCTSLAGGIQMVSHTHGS